MALHKTEDVVERCLRAIYALRELSVISPNFKMEIHLDHSSKKILEYELMRKQYKENKYSMPLSTNPTEVFGVTIKELINGTT